MLVFYASLTLEFQYPLCAELPSQSFLKKGAKYRLLGTLSRPELISQDDSKWRDSASAKRLVLQTGTSGLYEQLCSEDASGDCSFPGVVVLDKALDCKTSKDAECGDIELPRTVKVGQVFYEYVPFPCVDLAFFEGGVKVSKRRGQQTSMCANPKLPVASEACCNAAGTVATPNCNFAGERMSMATAAARCESVNKKLCDYGVFRTNDTCPHLGSHWTGAPCKVLAKVSGDGAVAIVHNTGTTVDPLVRENTPSFFKVSWAGGNYPNKDTCEGISGCSVAVDGQCLCEVEVSESPGFTTPPASKESLLDMLHVGVLDQTTVSNSELKSTTINGYTYHSKDGSCCSSETVFEVKEASTQRTFLLRNARSMVTISGSSLSFRNPPQFNNADPNSYSTIDAMQETEAVVDYLLYHTNTGPFVAFHLLQRFGISNPTPRFVTKVSNAFRTGRHQENDIRFGSGQYGDLEATMAAIVLDSDVSSSVSDLDPFTGSLREPILKVVGFMRAMEFQSTLPLVELHEMTSKIGQMAYGQPSVFSYFQSDFAPPGTLSDKQLVAPEAAVMSSDRVLGVINGLWDLVDNGLTNCNKRSFGYLGCELVSGYLGVGFSNETKLGPRVDHASALLTGGRLSPAKKAFIQKAASDVETDADAAFSLAVKMITATPEFHSTNVEDDFARQVTGVVSSNTGRGSYRAVIHLAFRGGCDSHSVLVPHPSCTKLSGEYKAVRGQLALPDDMILPLDGNATDQPQCSSFGVHHNLPFIKQLYDAGDLAFLANTGVLTQPVTRENFRPKTRSQLFSHNKMSAAVSELDPLKSLEGSGTLGRMANVLEAKGFRTGRTAIETGILNLSGNSQAAETIFTLSTRGVELLNLTDIATSGARGVMSQLNGRGPGATPSGTFGEVWASLLDQSMNQTETIFLSQQSANTTTQFGNGKLDRRVELISQLIQTREEREVDRDMFFLTLDGFDVHSNAIARTANLLQDVNKAITDLVSELKVLGVWDDVAIIQTSEFGRTLVPSSGGGLDHAWAGNYWMAGGNVKGKRILGEYPSLSLESDEIIDKARGRLLPTTPFDSPFQAIAEWMGVEVGVPSEINEVLPNRGNFPSLFRAGQVFEN